MRMMTTCVGLAALMLAGCGSGNKAAGNETAASEAAAAPDGEVVIHEAMTKVIIPQSTILWEVSSRALGETGEADVSQLTEADWAAMIKAGEAMSAESKKLAEASTLKIAAPGVKLQDEENPGSLNATQLQPILDADPDSFKAMASALAISADAFVDASRARDGAKLVETANALDQVCEACHTKYWYPPQPETK